MNSRTSPPSIRRRLVPLHPGAQARRRDGQEPAWLNDVTLYHNRGDSTFAGESSTYGDFVGLDDLFTEHPTVVRRGWSDIYKAWVDFGIDGFRIDTVKHVNLEFWQKFGPGPRRPRRRDRQRGLLHVRRGVQRGPDLHEHLHHGRQAARPRWTSPSRTRPSASPTGATPLPWPDMFADDDYYTDADSNAYSCPTFLGQPRHGPRRVLRRPASDALKDKFAHALMYTLRAATGRLLRRRAGVHRRPAGTRPPARTCSPARWPSTTATT